MQHHYELYLLIHHQVNVKNHVMMLIVCPRIDAALRIVCAHISCVIAIALSSVTNSNPAFCIPNLKNNHGNGPNGANANPAVIIPKKSGAFNITFNFEIQKQQNHTNVSNVLLTP